MGIDLSDLQKLVDVCTLCGSCNSSCPVFEIELTEPYSPRGRINLIGELLKGNTTGRMIRELAKLVVKSI